MTEVIEVGRVVMKVDQVTNVEMIIIVVVEISHMEEEANVQVMRKEEGMISSRGELYDPLGIFISLFVIFVI